MSEHKWPWRNNKTGKIYNRKRTIIDATNSRDGEKVVLYENEAGVEFVREHIEFLSKFTMVRHRDEGERCQTKS